MQILEHRPASAARRPTTRLLQTVAEDGYAGSTAGPLSVIPRPGSAPATALTGEVLRRGDTGWKAACQNFAARIDPASVEPKCIVFAQSVEDVANAVKHARENGLPLRARAGRHSYEAYSLVKDGLVVDVSKMKAIQVNPDTTVTVGAGVTVQELYEKLNRQGLMVPTATYPTVGLTGSTLGGGVGMTARKYGLTADNLVSLELVGADGQVMRASQDENPDLFWALKGGGGGNFGVVTQLTYKTHPARPVQVFSAEWEWKDFNAVVDAWQHWAPQADNDITSALALVADGKIRLYGQYTPDDPNQLGRGSDTLKELLAAAQPSALDVQVVPQLIASRIMAQVDPLDDSGKAAPPRPHQLFKSSSAFAYEPLPAEGIDKLRRFIENSPRQSGEVNQPDMVQLLPGGGQAASPATDQTGAFHRKSAFVLQYDAYWDHPQDEAATIGWVKDMREGLEPYTDGAYVNYHDSQLENPLVAYYGPNLVRLSEVKRKYDPHNVFTYPHGIPTQLTPELAAAALSSVPAH